MKSYPVPFSLASVAVATGRLTPAQGAVFAKEMTPTAADLARIAAAEEKRRRRATKRMGDRP